MKALNTLDLYSVSARALYLCAHFVEIVRKVYYLRLLCNVFKNCSTISQRCSYNKVFSSAYARIIEIYLCALEPVSLSLHIVRAECDLRAHLFKSLEMQIYRSCADSASARKRYSCAAETREQRSHRKYGRAHPLHKLCRSFVCSYMF